MNAPGDSRIDGNRHNFLRGLVHYWHVGLSQSIALMLQVSLRRSVPALFRVLGAAFSPRRSAASPPAASPLPAARRLTTTASAPPPPVLSHVFGASSTPLLYDTLGGALSRAAAAWPTRRALISRSHGAALTWRELDAAVTQTAAGLLAAGVQRGDKVACWSLNRPEWVLTQLAAARCGAVFVTLNPAYRAREVAQALRASGAVLLVTAAAFKTSDYIAMLREVAPELPSCAPGALRAAALPALRTVDRKSVV